MAYSHTLDLVQGDTNPQISMVLRDKNRAAPGKTLDPSDETTWSPIDLTGGQVRMYIREIGARTIKDTLVGLVTDPAEGFVVFLLNPNTLDTAGVFEAEIEFTDSAGRVQTVYDLVRLRVREQF